MELMNRSGGFSLGKGVSASNLARSDFLSGAVGVERSELKCVRTRAVLGWVRHVMSRIGDVAFSEFGSGESTMLRRRSAWVFNVDIIRLEVGVCLIALRLKEKSGGIT